MRFLTLLASAALAFAADPAAALQSTQLPFDPSSGYLPALLQALKIPIESQLAVFSKTSIQSLRIEPSNPRLLYFNDSVIVGSVRGGFLELASQDPEKGLQFYTLQQRPDSPLIHRQDCVNCHKSGTTLLRSVIPSPDGIPSRESDQPFGGWFVTGASLPSVHAGNTVFANSEKRALTPPVQSDIVALMVFAQQLRIMNLLAHPDNIDELVDAFLNETPLPSPIKGTSGFTEKFEALGPFDRCGRSLRQFDLHTRLMRYPCSYMIYTPAFDALPASTKSAIYRRLQARPDGHAVLEILRDTKPDLSW